MNTQLPEAYKDEDCHAYTTGRVDNIFRYSEKSNWPRKLLY